MSGPPPSERTKRMVAAYIHGDSGLEVAKRFKCTKQQVYYAVHTHAPHAIRGRGPIRGKKRGPYYRGKKRPWSGR